MATSVSVVIPTYGRSELLASAIESVLRQSHPHVEVIVVDDGSPEPASGHRDQRVRVVRQDNAGVAVARNRGVDEATGDYVFFLDDDDEYTPTRVANALLAHEESGADIVVCGQSWLGGGEALTRTLTGNVGNQILDAITPHVGATSVRRDAFIPFEPRYLASQDVDWWLRIAQVRTVHSIKTVDCLIRRHDAVRHSNGMAQRVEFGYQLLADHADYFAVHPTARSFRLTRLAQSSLNIADTDTAVRASLQACRSRPRPSTARTATRALVQAFRDLIEPDPTLPVHRPLLSSAHAREWTPRRHGPPEARLVPVPRMMRVAVRIASLLQPPWAGRVRALAARSRTSRQILVRSAFGTFSVAPRDHTLLRPFFFEVFETAIASRLIEPGMTVIDIGANRGWYTAVAAHLVGDDGVVVAVEPDPRMRALLQRTIDGNDWRDRVRVDDRALSDSTDQQMWARESEGSLSHLAGDGESTGEMVATTTLDALISDHRLGTPGFIKIDVEGAEFKVLRSCDFARFGGALPVILLEFQPDMLQRYGDDPLALLTLLRDAGYSLFQIRPSEGDVVAIDDDPSWLASATAGDRHDRNLLAISTSTAGDVLGQVFIDPPTAEGA